MKIRNGLFQAVLGFCLVLVLGSCGSKQPLPTEEQRQEARRQVPCVVVLPVETMVDSDPAVSYQTAAELEKGAAFMDTVLAEQMVGHNNVRVLSDRQLTALIPEGSGAQLALIRKIGSDLKCDAVMTTRLSVYRQRVGGSYGVDSPASAMFTMKLARTRDGEVLWTATFKETQEWLFGNIFSFNKAERRGFKWITVEELVRQGVAEKIAECPYL